MKAILAAIYAPFTLFPLYFLNYALVASYGAVGWEISVFLLAVVLMFSFGSTTILAAIFSLSKKEAARQLHSHIVSVNNFTIITSILLSLLFLFDENLVAALVSSGIGGALGFATYKVANFLEAKTKELDNA